MEQNVFDYLLERYREANPGTGGELAPFVDFCKGHLRDNPPTGTATVSDGLAVRLQRGQVLNFSQKPAPAATEVRGVFINKNAFDPTTHGISGTDAVNITDPNKG